MFVTRTADRRSRGADADIADTIDQSLRHTDVARELRDNGLPSSGKEHAMPRPSEKNKKKLRKVRVNGIGERVLSYEQCCGRPI